jgi:hypothetical protein
MASSGPTSPTRVTTTNTTTTNVTKGISFASRFSTLNVFKLAVKHDNSDKGPPPLPPKDPYWLYSNRSLASLAIPMSPRSRNQSSPSPGPSQSSLSLTSSVHSLTPSLAESSAAGRRKEAIKTGFGKAIQKFGKRNPRSPNPPTSPPPDQDQDQHAPDDGISRPYNFQVRLSHIAPHLPPSSRPFSSSTTYMLMKRMYK